MAAGWGARSARWGVALAVAGVVWQAAGMVRRRGVPPAMVDWEQIARLAGRLAGPEAIDRRIAPDIAPLIDHSQELIGRETGWSVDRRLAEALRVVDRQEWVNLNVGNFRWLLQPLQTQFDQSVGQAGGTAWLVADGTRHLLSAQMGVLLGYMGRRVLGQYETPFFRPTQAEEPAILLVEPNLRQVQGRLRGVPLDDLRLYVSIHEVTHAFQFEAVPWLRGYLEGLIGQLLNAVAEQGIDLSGRQNMLVGTIKLALSQRSNVAAIQATMTLIEGHATYVANRLGREHVASFPILEPAFRNRHRPVWERLLQQITGLQMKAEQYRQGEQFVEAVAKRCGFDHVQRAWTSPQTLPTPTEIRHPAQWIARMEGLR